MRWPCNIWILVGLFLLGPTWTGQGQTRRQDPKHDPYFIERQLFESLRDVHNKGADLYDAGDRVGCYRMFQGALQTARALLEHRPAEQKFIDQGLADAARLSTPAARAYALHDVITALRKRIQPPAIEAPEVLTILPRIYQPKPEIKLEPPKLVPPVDGVAGVVFLEGTTLSGVDVLFVTRGVPEIRVYETSTNSQGEYVIAGMQPGMYTVLLQKRSNGKSQLPERYATTQTSPLIMDVKRGGEMINLLLRQ